jgi:hypothetical protein
MISLVAREQIEIVQSHLISFKADHPDFKQLDPDRFSQEVLQAQQMLAKVLKVSQRPIPLNPMELLSLQNSEGLYLLMRHGEQAMGPTIVSLQEAEKKIAMMREEENITSPITDSSLIDLFAIALAVVYLDHPFLHWSIESSHNTRAKEAGELIAFALQLPCTLESDWNCVNYPTHLSTEELIRLLPGGTLPWKRLLVDQVIGEGTYDKITRHIQQSIYPELGQAKIAITHTQQLNACAEKLNLPVIRMGNYAFIVGQIKSGSIHYRMGKF